MFVGVFRADGGWGRWRKRGIRRRDAYVTLGAVETTAFSHRQDALCHVLFSAEAGISARCLLWGVVARTVFRFFLA